MKAHTDDQFDHFLAQLKATNRTVASAVRHCKTPMYLVICCVV